MSLTQLYATDAYGSTFADPLDPNFTVRFKTTRNRKNLKGISVENFVTEIIVNDLNSVTVGSDTVNDSVAVRIRLSGSEYSHDRIKAILAQLGLDVPNWNDENVFLGFRPTTSPSNP